MHYGIATAEDLPELKQLGLASFGMHKQHFTEEGWKEFSEGLENEKTIRALFDRSTVFTCRDQDALVGAAYFISSGHPEGMFHKDWSYIRRVSVHPDHQGKGIAKELTRLCIDHAKQTGEKEIVLHTGEFMKPAIHIYESMGFKKFKEAEPICGKKYWLYRLLLNQFYSKDTK